VGKTSNVVSSAALALTLLLSVAGCSALTVTQESPSVEAEETNEPQATQNDANEEALNAYIEAESSTIPAIMDQYPGVYQDILIEGSIEEFAGDDEIPAGTYSVATFTYIYATPMDWAATTPQLDEQRPTIDDACTSTIFPAMRNAGVTGPLGVVFSYGDLTTAPETMWSHTCTE
jgi:hypothetical protein